MEGQVDWWPRERFLFPTNIQGAAPTGRQRHPPKPPSVQCRKLWDNPHTVWKLSFSFLPSWSDVHACLLLGLKTSRRKLRCYFHLGKLEKFWNTYHVSWSWLSPHSTHTRGVLAGDVRVSPCPVHHVTCAFLQKELISK